MYAYFEETQEFYLIQEFIDGKTLAQKVNEEGILDEDSVIEIIISLLDTLMYVHSKGVIHRDIKPDNIILRQKDTKPVLIDFGAVKEIVTTIIGPYGTPSSSIIIGTPGYMPLEQA